MMKERKRLRAFLSAAMYLGIYVIVQMVIEGIYLLYCQSVIGTTFADLYKELMKSVYAINVISSIISLWIYALIGKLRKKPIAQAVKNSAITPASMFMIVISAIGARLMVSAYFFFAEEFKPLKNSIENSSLATPEFTYFYQIIIALFSIVIIAPFFEEVLFRGLVMGEFLKIMRPWAAIVLQAIIFGVAHLALFQSSFAFVVGILLGIIYYKTSSIKAVAVFHGVFNVTAPLSQIAQNTSTAIAMLIFGIVIIGISVFYIAHTSNAK